jgi:hypothetical protein
MGEMRNANKMPEEKKPIRGPRREDNIKIQEMRYSQWWL